MSLDIRGYILIHEVIFCCSKLRDWSLHLSPDNFDLHQGKECKCDHKTWDPQKAYFQAYIIHYHGPTGFAVGKAKEVFLQQKLMDHGKAMPY
jgi:hypothetical protein